ncbi:MAG: leucine-rich repeat domain-containing protein, partial [Chitinophagaceae bacterium]
YEVPNSICALSKLELLDLSNNSLQALPNCIGQLKKLKFLYLARNSFSRLPESLGNLTAMQELDVVRCGVLILPSSLANLPRLDRVYIDDHTTPFYPNPAYSETQRIITVNRDDFYPYRSSTQ